jgi:hypothetical protein
MTISDCHIGHCIIRRIWEGGEVSLRGDMPEKAINRPKQHAGKPSIKKQYKSGQKKEMKE